MGETREEGGWGGSAEGGWKGKALPPSAFKSPLPVCCKMLLFPCLRTPSTLTFAQITGTDDLGCLHTGLAEVAARRLRPYNPQVPQVR